MNEFSETRPEPPLADAIAGEFVTETFDYNDGRQVTVYVPGELALALGLRHPELYGAIFSASPGAGRRPPDALPSRLPRTYPLAGALEPFFLHNAARWAAALRDANADVVMSERAAGHDDEMWRREFPLMIR
jgi:enterochelin esterase-like enzyme